MLTCPTLPQTVNPNSPASKLVKLRGKHSIDSCLAAAANAMQQTCLAAAAIASFSCAPFPIAHGNECTDRACVDGRAIHQLVKQQQRVSLR